MPRLRELLPLGRVWFPTTANCITSLCASALIWCRCYPAGPAVNACWTSMSGICDGLAAQLMSVIAEEDGETATGGTAIPDGPGRGRRRERGSGPDTPVRTRVGAGHRPQPGDRIRRLACRSGHGLPQVAVFVGADRVEQVAQVRELQVEAPRGGPGRAGHRPAAQVGLALVPGSNGSRLARSCGTCPTPPRRDAEPTGSSS